MGVATLNGAFAPSAGTRIDYAAELNEQQLAAVTSPGGGALVIAGAGSGKTRTLIYRVAWLLENGVKPWEILLLTFTNKAAREMTGRGHLGRHLPLDWQPHSPPPCRDDRLPARVQHSRPRGPVRFAQECGQ
jgi:hypothetical protein